ncbi:MAG: 4-deoxy-4-formamido-L-arabinose-phosphoundecaprenol deformylase [Burkholderiaceae bacterium]|nr:4-deoxy-4-formamido-L-arabinose-phosphoundecaprenol deformylase [Burkholderiaceae bacterium]
MRRLALKIDVDTWLGTRDGVPRLLDALERNDARASFLFSLGPDHTGRAIRRALRPGFLGKVSRTSVVEHYGIRTLLYGTLLPGPDIGRREASMMRSVRERGFEVGVHCWDHVLWQDRVGARDAAWTREQMRLAVERFGEIFGTAPRVHGAAGWQMNEAAWPLERELGFEYASDTRGAHAFRPVDAEGREIGVPQLPTTLPTLDEMIGLHGVTADNADARLLALTAKSSPETHVYTLHAELEGGRLGNVFERLLRGWRAQGWTLVGLDGLFASLDAGTLPAHRVAVGTVPGRSGTLAVQGDADAGLRP